MRATLICLLVIVATGVGAIAGALVAFYGTYFGCVLIDAVNGVQGGGNSAMTVGWVFLLFTIPFGAFFGSALSVPVALSLMDLIFDPRDEDCQNI